MLRLGGVASSAYMVAFPAIIEHFQRQGIDLDWVLYSGWDALVDAFVWLAPSAGFGSGIRRRSLVPPLRIYQTSP